MRKVTLLLSGIALLFVPSTVRAQHELWGMTANGGSAAVGSIYKVQPDGTNPAVQFSFSKDNDAGPPTYDQLAEASNGKLYGMTAGGANGKGIIFSYNPSTNAFTKELDFAGANGDTPNGGLTLGSGGKFYGMTSRGGANSSGVLFSFDPVTSVFTKLFDFSNALGSFPQGNLVQTPGGILYGMTNSGGINFSGTLFSFDPSNSSYSKLIDFSTATGSTPYGSLTLTSNGKLYGMTYNGGSNNSGVIFSFDPVTSTYSKLLDFSASATGANPYGTLIQDPTGRLAGVTYAGGIYGVGVLFQFDPASNTFFKLFDFDGTHGSNPQGSLSLTSTGLLVGLTHGGGAQNQGTIFSYGPFNGIFTKLFDFASPTTGGNPQGKLLAASDGRLYGLAQGGPVGHGVLFSFDPSTNTFARKLDFSTSYATGTGPDGNLMKASDGKFYGMTQGGGTYFGGVLFSFDPNTSTFSKLLDFVPATGSNPEGGNLTQAPNGKLYGMTLQGGANNYGVLFEYDPVSRIYIDKYDFSATSGAQPTGSLTLAPNGKLYGMTGDMGVNFGGSLFDYDPDLSVFTKHVDFTSVTGSYPQGKLLLASDGKMYGLTRLGGVNNQGTIFSFDMATNSVTKLMDFSSSSRGANPWGGLTQAPDGKLYGTTNSGGTSGNGVLFSFDPTNNLYSRLFNFSNGVGVLPSGYLSIGANGDLFGLTIGGGTGNAGVLYEFTPSTSGYQIKSNLPTTVGYPYYYSALLTFPAIASFSPQSGLSGTTVTITGFNFDPIIQNNIVRFNGIQGAVVSGTVSSLNVVVPPGATTGPISLITNGTTTTSSSNFTVGLIPTISSFSPSAGAAGTAVIITGTNFDLVPSNNSVLFNGTAAVVTASSATSLTATVPAGATTGPISVTVNGLSGNSLNSFNITFAISIASMQPLTGGVYDPTQSFKIVYPEPIGTYLRGNIYLRDQNDQLIETLTSSQTTNYSVTNTATSGTLSFKFNFAFPAGNYKITTDNDLMPSYPRLNIQPLNGNYQFGTLGDGSFNPPLYSVTAPIVYASPSQGCSSFTNNVAGAVALIDRGTCSFPIKVKNAQLAGAIGVIIANNTTGVALMGGSDPTITIPSVMISQSDGIALKSSLASASQSATISNSDRNELGIPAGNPWTFSVRSGQVITFDVLSTKTFGDSSFTLTATGGGSGQPVTYTSSNSLVATVSGDTVAIVGAGTITITASQAGGGNYDPAPDVAQTLTVNKANQTLSVPGTHVVITQVYGGGGNSGSYYKNDFVELYNPTNSPVPLTGWSIQYASTTGSTWTSTPIGGTLQPNSFFLVQMSAGGGGVAALPTPDFTGIIPMGANAGKIGLCNSTTLLTGANPASANLVDLVGYGFGTTGFEGSGPTASLTNTSAASRIVHHDTNDNAADFRVTVPSPRNSSSPLSETVSPIVIPGLFFGDAPFQLGFIASSGLPVTYSSDNTAIATVSGNTIAIVGSGFPPGTVNLKATQAGDANYDSTEVIIQLLVRKASQSIVSFSNMVLPFGNPDFALTAAATSGLPVTYSSSDTSVVVILGTTASLRGAGTATITASQSGNGNYDPAPSVQRTLTVSKASQSITFNTLTPKTYGDSPFVLTATSTSGLPVRYSTSDSTAISIAGNTVSVLRADTVMITASQPGDNNYFPASTVSQSLVINKATLIANPDDKTINYGDSLPAFTITYSGFVGNENVSVIDLPPTAQLDPAVPAEGGGAAAAAGAVVISPPQFRQAGTYRIIVTPSEDDNYDIMSTTTGLLTINRASLEAKADNKSKNVGEANPALTISYTGFKGTEDASYLNWPPTISTTADSSSGAGTYPIILTANLPPPMPGVKHDNYEISLVNGTLTINSVTLAPVFVVTPANHALNQNVTLNLTSKGLAGASTYTIELNESSNFTGTGQVISGTKTLNFSGLSYSKQYFTRVKTNLSPDWGQVTSFSTATPDFFSYVMSPVNNATNVKVALNVTSNTVIGASQYTIELNTASDFSGTALVKTGARTQSFTGLSYNTVYYARVQTDLSDSTNWGPTRMFTTINVPPTYVVAPANGAINQKVTLNVTANAVAGATLYTVQLSTSPDFIGDSLVQTGARTQSFTGLQYNTLYYSRAKTDLLPDWGVSKTFTTMAVPMSYVTNPINGATGVSLNATVTALVITGANTYTLEVSTDSTFAGTILSKTGTRTQNFSGLLSYNTTYFTRVKTDLSPAYGAVKKFTTVSPWALSYITSPVNGASNVNWVTNLTANTVAGAATYTIEANPDPEFGGGTAIVRTGASRTWGFNLSSDQLYYVRVQTDLAPGQWGITKSFTTGDALSLAYVTSPKNGGTGVPTSVTVVANGLAGATGYTIELNTEADFSGTPIVISGVARSKTFSGLLESTTYYTRVQSSLAPGQWGTINTHFSTINPMARGVGDWKGDESDQEVTLEPFGVKIFGNPFHEKLNFLIETPAEQEASVILCDITGKTVHESTERTNAFLAIEKPLSQGIYLLRVQTAQGTKAIRVLKID